MNEVIRMDNLYILDIEADTPRKRGEIHGETLRGVIRTGVENWMVAIEGLGLDPKKMIDHFVSESNFRGAIDRWTPDLLEEVWGIADGAGQDRNVIYAYQLMDDFFGYLTKNLAPHCTSVAVAGDDHRPTLVSQNQDLPGCYDGTQTVIRMHYKESGLKTLIFTLAGNIGQNVANNHGLGLAINTLGFLKPSPKGLPSMFIVRRIGEQKSLADAETFLRSVEHSSSMNYLMGDDTGILDLEASQNTVAAYDGIENGTCRSLWHTNHPLANDNLQEEFSGPLSDDFLNEKAYLSAARLKKTAEMLRETPRPTIEDIKKIYSAEPVCLRSDLSETLASVIFELGPDPVLHIAPGTPDTVPYRRITL